jgi:hypothetical protein
MKSINHQLSNYKLGLILPINQRQPLLKQQALYADHDVNDIARNDAGAQNLHVTSQALQEIIHQARLQRRKTICFVTGVPAGKTLVGLNIATNVGADKEEQAVFYPVTARW